MDILKTAIDWAKAEVFSSQFFIFFGILFVIGTIGFWQLGKTELAKAFIFPTLVPGILLLAIGLGLFFTNKAKTADFPTVYNSDPSSFVKSEIAKTEKIMGEYQTIVFKVIPGIIAAAALLLIFVDVPIWRAISITTIALMVVILFIDSNAYERVKAYNQQLISVEKNLDN